MISSCMDTLSAWKFSYSSRLDFFAFSEKWPFWIRKLFGREKFVKILQFCTFCLLTTLIWQENCGNFFEWKIRESTTVLCSLSVDNFDLSRNLCKQFFEWKIRETTTVLCCLAVDNFDLTRKITEIFLNERFVKILQFCTFWLLTTLISREKL